ncbi:MAG: hypothetical protein MJK08_03905 [Campylobacterales bacterium]|nr:hypothetical protein [Campylobacterales bacterium]
MCQNGGGFTQRPKNNLKDNNFLGNNPSGAKIYHFLVDLTNHIKFSNKLKNIHVNER